MSGLREAAEDYLAVRRALGFKLRWSGHRLLQFADYGESLGLERVTTEAALAWASLPANADPGYLAARLQAVRGFAIYQNALDPETEIPPSDLFPYRSRRAEPFLYTQAEIVALQTAAAITFLGIKATTYDTLIGLLAVTGMRVGEAICLDRGDLDWDSGVITVRAAKFNKTRLLPLHPSTVEALRGYAATRDRHVPSPATDAFFVSIPGKRLIYQNVHASFHRLTKQVGLKPRSATCRPRIHDLRHRFAVMTLTRWYRCGVDVDGHLYLLSTYLGHANPSSTYWYLTATPELLGMAADRLNTAKGALR